VAIRRFALVAIKLIRAISLIALLGWTVDTAYAQMLEFDIAVSGRIDDETPRTIYTFDGLRGEAVSFALTVTEGDLEPLVIVYGVQTGVVAGGGALSDEAPGADIRYSGVRLPASDSYSVVVTRFGDRLGTTAGDYSLTVARVGASSESGSVLRYGDSIYNAIDDQDPQIFYTFEAARGDVISVRMQRASGDLDAAVQIVNSRSEVVAENDDEDGTLDAAINGYVAREDGVHAIVASRFGGAAGKSRGSFVLTLLAGAESGLGRSIEFALPLVPGTPTRGQITANRSVIFYRFDAARGDVVTVRMERSGGSELDPLLLLTDTNGRELGQDDDGGGGQNAALRDILIPTTGTYLVQATRFEGEAGTTSGAFTLTLELGTSAFSEVPADAVSIEYNGTMNGTITNETPSVRYAFFGEVNDLVTLRALRVNSDLDATLTLFNPSGQVISRDDDSGGAQNPLIDRLALPETGVYVIEVGRYSGTTASTTTTGVFTFSLVLLP